MSLIFVKSDKHSQARLPQAARPRATNQPKYSNLGLKIKSKVRNQRLNVCTRLQYGFKPLTQGLKPRCKPLKADCKGLKPMFQRSGDLCAKV